MSTQSSVNVSEKQSSSANAGDKSPIYRPGWSYREFVALGAVALIFVLVFWDALSVLVQRWWSDADYHHGFLVPLFAGYLLWRRRGLLDDRWMPSQVSWTAIVVGAVLLVIAGCLRAASVMFYARIVDPAAIVPAFLGLLLVLGGWKWLRWGWPAGVFLVFMLPLPGFVATMLSHPLQRAATIASTFLLQTIGVPCIPEGNVITLEHGQLEVVQACSGLKMMSLFFAVCFGAAFLMDRPVIDRILIIISAPVIALLSNILRISITGVLHQWGIATANLDHELAGWLMMPLAVLILAGLLAVWDRLVTSTDESAGHLVFATEETP